MTLLFGPVPGGPELAVIGLVGLLATLLALGVAYWVYRDASRHGNDNPEIWAIAVALAGVFGSLLGLVVVFALYLLVGRD